MRHLVAGRVAAEETHIVGLSGLEGDRHHRVAHGGIHHVNALAIGQDLRLKLQPRRWLHAPLHTPNFQRLVIQFFGDGKRFVIELRLKTVCPFLFLFVF